MCTYGIRSSRESTVAIHFDLIVRNHGGKTVTLMAVFSPDDEGGPCLTIMLPEED